jgi:hypothetical protein
MMMRSCLPLRSDVTCVASVLSDSIRGNIIHTEIYNTKSYKYSMYLQLVCVGLSRSSWLNVLLKGHILLS